jgi:sulfur-oxidizing protein SoxB
MLTRRDFLQVTAATAAMGAFSGGIAQAAARQKITQDSLLRFRPVGQVTLLNFTDMHAQLVPIYFREPSVNLGVGADRGLPPHLTGKALLSHFHLKPGSPEAYAFSCTDFTHLAREYGMVGGVDRLATLVKAIRAERPHNTLLIDGGDTWQGSYTSLQNQGEDMVEMQNLLGVDTMTGHWEFTYGTDRVKELIKKCNFPFLAGNVQDTEWEQPVFPGIHYYERAGVKIAVIGQAFPYTPVANPRWMIPTWSFGIHQANVQKEVDEARAKGADLVVLNSHNGFDVDRKLASKIHGLDVILTGHTHDAIPAMVKVNGILLVAAGSHGKFLARLDLDVRNKKVHDYSFRLIPIFSDAIKPDPEMAALVAKIRKPHEAVLGKVLAHTDSLLYRRGNFNGTFDDLICEALLQERDGDLAFSPGFRWGASLLPGQAITTEDIYNQTAITYPAAYRSQMTGAQIKSIMEQVADNLFNADPYYQQGGDMVRMGGMTYTIDPYKTIGHRITDIRVNRTGKVMDPNRKYWVSGWASVNQGTQGPAIWDVISSYLGHHKTVRIPERPVVKVVGT